MCENRVPADNCYRGGDTQDPARPAGLPIFRPMQDYESLAQCGARLFGVLDVSAFSGNGTMKQNYSQSELDNMMRMLEPTVSQLESLGLADKAYVYGFDEEPVSYGHAIYRECRNGRLGRLTVAATLTRPFLRTEGRLRLPLRSGLQKPAQRLPVRWPRIVLQPRLDLAGAGPRPARHRLLLMPRHTQ